MAPQWEGPWLDLEDFPCKSEVWWFYVGLVFHEAFWNDLRMSRLFHCFKVRNHVLSVSANVRLLATLPIQCQQVEIEARCECSLTREESYSKVSRLLRK